MPARRFEFEDGSSSKFGARAESAEDGRIVLGRGHEDGLVDRAALGEAESPHDRRRHGRDVANLWRLLKDNDLGGKELVAHGAASFLAAGAGALAAGAT